ncbi:MAG: TVP38/TMEM64 family protein [Verrucomicrobiota bacterium]
MKDSSSNSPPSPPPTETGGVEPAPDLPAGALRLPRRRWRRLSLAARALAAVLVAWLLWHHWDQEAFLTWKREAGPLPFFTALALLPAVGFPTTPFYLLAGATFSLPVALGGSFLALAVNLILCYALAKGPMRRSLRRLLERLGYQLPDFGKRRSWQFLLMVKFMPGVPTFVKHYLLGLAGVPFAVYFTASMVITGLYLSSFVVLGESVTDKDFTVAAVALGVLILLGLAIWAYKRRRHRTE